MSTRTIAVCGSFAQIKHCKPAVWHIREGGAEVWVPDCDPIFERQRNDWKDETEVQKDASSVAGLHAHALGLSGKVLFRSTD